MQCAGRSRIAATVEESPAEEQPTAGRTPTADAPTAPGNTGVSVGWYVNKVQGARTISNKLAANIGKRPDNVTCPVHLPARAGATIRCELTAGGVQ
ncbi:DUF4333 domain-containing protein [Streptomyces sp. UG1]|uniref:DUF4333 domain-containing protein n=1 Tax=Streptomyces sp. UG1 TaxID=3417652 RepID=UPI003CF1DD69